MDPFTMMAVGATAGAILNPNDPVKGAVMGGAMGYGGGALMGAGATGGLAAGSTVGAGGIGAGGTGLTATTLGGAVPASAGLGAASGGATGLSAAYAPAAASYGGMLGTATPAAAGMGGAGGLLGASSVTGAASAPFAAATGPEMLSAPMQLGGSRMQQAQFANQLLARNKQAQQRAPMAPAIQSRPYTGMQRPVNPEEEEMRRRMAYQMPPMPQIRLI